MQISDYQSRRCIFRSPRKHSPLRFHSLRLYTFLSTTYLMILDLTLCFQLNNKIQKSKLELMMPCRSLGKTCGDRCRKHFITQTLKLLLKTDVNGGQPAAADKP